MMLVLALKTCGSSETLGVGYSCVTLQGGEESVLVWERQLLVQRLQQGHGTVKASKPVICTNSCTQLTDWNIRLCRNLLHKPFFSREPTGSTGFRKCWLWKHCFWKHWLRSNVFLILMMYGHFLCLWVHDRKKEAILIQQNPQVTKERILFNGLGRAIRDDQMWACREVLFASSKLWRTKDRKEGIRVIKKQGSILSEEILLLWGKRSTSLGWDCWFE